MGEWSAAITFGEITCCVKTNDYLCKGKVKLQEVWTIPFILMAMRGPLGLLGLASLWLLTSLHQGWAVECSVRK